MIFMINNISYLLSHKGAGIARRHPGNVAKLVNAGEQLPGGNKETNSGWKPKLRVQIPPFPQRQEWSDGDFGLQRNIPLNPPSKGDLGIEWSKEI